MKTCPRCERALPLSAYYRRNGKPSSYCKECHRAYYRDQYRNDPERRAQVLARQATPEAKARRTERLYGMAPGEYGELVAKTGGRCTVCNEPPGAHAHPVDHDHGSGRVRGILCHNCNRGIGLLGDDTVRLRAAADYLESTTS